MHIREIQTGNSVILVWVEPPRLSGNIITFAGITPGGFEGVRPIFSLHGAFSNDELERVHFDSAMAFKNDGTGENVRVAVSTSLVSFKTDTEAPERFTLTIAADPNIFDGKYFLAFTAQDKGAGVDRYEVKEGRWGRFREAESPYLLRHQDLNRAVYVKAIDNAGNEIVAVVPASTGGTGWDGYILFVTLLLIALASILYKKQWTRFTR
jgi:hypothetical protein